MVTQVTQCPSCQTSFRVTEAQLTIANGAVRCGSCLHIFNATEHWLDGNRNAPATESRTESAEPLIEQAPNYDSQPSSSPERFWQSTDDLDTDVVDAGNIFSANDQSALDNIFNDDIFAIDEASVEDNVDPQTIEPVSIEPATMEPANDGLAFESVLVDGDANIDTGEPADRDDILEDSDFIIDGAIDEVIEGNRKQGDGESASAEDDDDGDALIYDTAAHPVIEIDDGTYDYQDLEIEEQLDENASGAFSDNFLDLDLEDNTDDTFFSEDTDAGDDQEEAWAKKLLEEDTGEQVPAEHSSEYQPEPEPESQSEQQPEQQQEQLSTDHAVAEQSEEYLFDYEQPIEEQEFDESLFETHDNIFDSLQEETEQPLDPELFDILNEHDNILDAEVEEDEFILGGEPMLAGDRVGHSGLDLLANIEPEPVVFANRGDHNRWLKRGWSIGTAAALVLLFAQYIAFNFDRLSRDQSYRPLFASACPLLGCTLPDMDNIKLIRSTNLMVRSHPDYQNALVVDAIISNRASFQQRFPTMELQFTNLAGDIVAGRHFKPSEYLAGELKGSSTMPVNQPIHVSLEIIDPGQLAVSYQLRLHPQKEG